MPPVAMMGGGAPSMPSSSGLIREGMSGANVSNLQSMLNKAGYNVGATDGIFGAKTQSALEAYQKANGLQVDGIAGPQTMGRLNSSAPSAAQRLTSAMRATPVPAATDYSSPSAHTQPTNPSPQPSYDTSEVTSAPVYSGPHVASIPHVASSLGASYTHNPADGTYNVNGQTIKPTSIVGGVGHAPVTQIAQVANHPMNLVTSDSKGTTVMPNTAAKASPSPQLNQYWTNVEKAGGAYANPNANGMSLQQQIQNEAQMYGIHPSQVQVIHEKDGSTRTFVPWQYVQAHAIAASNPQPAQQPAQQTQPQPAYDPMAALQANQGQYLQNMVGSAPQAPQLQPMPQLDASQFQPFQWDMAGDYANVYGSLNPTYQQQMVTADQKINDAMNKRGIYTSGIAQQAVNQNDQALAQNEWNAINKQVTSDQGNAIKAWQDNNTNQLNAYKEQLDAAYKSGQLTDQQYNSAINEWGKLVSAQTSMANQDASMIGKMLPYTMGPTPEQLATLSGTLPNGQPTLQAQQDAFNNALNYFKTTAPYSQLTADQQAQLALNYYKTNLPYQQMTANQAATLGLNYAKFQNTVQQQQVTDAQKWASIMGYDANGNPTLNMQKLQVTMQDDLQKAQQAAATASNNDAKTQLTGLHDQLVAAGQYITNLTAQGVKANDPAMQDAVKNYNSINDEITGIVASEGTSGGNAIYAPGSPLMTPN